MTTGNVRGDTEAGAAIGAGAGQPLAPNFPTSPTGSDTKSVAIAKVLNDFLDTAWGEHGTYNTSLDTLRQGLVQAPQAVEATDESGAAAITASGEVYTT